MYWFQYRIPVPLGTSCFSRKTGVASGRMTITTIREHCELVRNLARGLARGRGDHEDLAQDAIERWLRALPHLPPATNHKAWLTTVLRHLFVDRLRRRHTRGELSTDCARLPDADREVLPWWLELGVVDVDRELAKLPSGQRATFRLFAFEGKSYDEIARQQGISKSTVGTRILRARLQLKQLLAALNEPRALMGGNQGAMEDRRSAASLVRNESQRSER
jgi:RNA polymerase sigma-70 factor (ECF subfamily)